MNLYELSDTYQSLYQALETNEYEGKEEFDAIIDGLLEAGEAFDDKAENYIKVINQLKADEKMVTEEIVRLTKKKKSIESNRERLKDTLKEEMKRTDKQKIKTPLFSIWVQKNPASVQYREDVEVPDEYVKIERKNDTKKVRQALKDGEVLPFAELVQTEGLRYR